MGEWHLSDPSELHGSIVVRRRRGPGRAALLLCAAVASLAMVLLGANPAGAQAPGEVHTSPFPNAPADSGFGRRIVYSVEQQRVWWVDENNMVANSYLVSGKANTPRPGHYAVFSKSRHTTSMNGSARMEYMVRFTWGNSAAIGFHSIPVNGRGQPLQSEAELGQYRSAGCIRQRLGDAAGLYDFAHIGTPVVVVK